MSMPSEIRIREVGPRDGLQAEEPMSVEDRSRFLDAVSACGFTTIEAVAFVSPKAVPSMADAAAVLADHRRVPGVSYVALVPNVRGAEMAVAADIDALSVTVSASAQYNEKNVHMSIAESVAGVSAIRDLVGEEMSIEAVVSCAFGSPYEGDIAPDAVARLGGDLSRAGATGLTYADTTGMATPRRIQELVEATGSKIGLHLHETRGTALVNAYAAMQLGVADFDTSVGGLGGSPFADGAAGNLATEDLVHLCDDIGVATGIDLGRVLEASALVAELVGHPVPSRVAAAGPRTRLAPAS